MGDEPLDLVEDVQAAGGFWSIGEGQGYQRRV
jgi:hypothetical protein